MKKRICLILLIVFAALFVLLLGICLNKQRKITISLASNPSTGYSWSYKMSKEGIVKLIASKYQEDKHDSNMVGVGGKEFYTFEALKEGKVTITFIYTSPGGEASTNKNITLKVSKDLNITKE